MSWTFGKASSGEESFLKSSVKRREMTQGKDIEKSGRKGGCEIMGTEKMNKIH